MGQVEKIFKVNAPLSHSFSSPQRQSPEAVEDYAVKKVIATKELTLSDNAEAGYVMNDANGVLTGGHAGGEIGDISHTELSDIGTNTHAEIDTHIASSAIHFTLAAIDHTAISNIGTNTHAAIDTHIASTSIHLGTASISHTEIQDIGTNTHAAIDTHIASAAIHFTQGNISIPASQISDFDTEVANNTAVAANTASTHAQNTDTILGQSCVALDHGTAATDMIINICYGTSATPPAANTTTIGTLYIRYLE